MSYENTNQTKTKRRSTSIIPERKWRKVHLLSPFKWFLSIPRWQNTSSWEVLFTTYDSSTKDRNFAKITFLNRTFVNVKFMFNIFVLRCSFPVSWNGEWGKTIAELEAYESLSTLRFSKLLIANRIEDRIGL